MVQINEEKLQVQWASLKDKYFTDLSSMPSDCHFSAKKVFKISLASFLYGFISMLLKGGNSLNHWAMQTGNVGGFLLSKQGLDKKLNMVIAHFMSQLLMCVLRKRLQESGSSLGTGNGLLSSFPNVYLQDSTCMSVPDNLSAYFKSSYSRLNERATARIQVCMNLKSHYLTSLTLQGYRDNDQKHASVVVPLLKKGDLLIRDLGYAVLSAFKAIISVQAFFLSRLRADVLVYGLSDTENALNLHHYLLNCDKNGQIHVDISVLLGKKEKVPVRLVALKLPQKVADERRRKANLNRDKRCKPTEASMYLLGWAIFITNVPLTIWQPTDLAKVYRMRWRIEIIFKTWKSHFHFDHIFQTSAMTYPRALISFYLLLLFITLFFVRWFDYFATKIIENSRNAPRWLSVFKFADFVKLFFDEIFKADLNQKMPELIKNVQYYCCYDKRKRTNDSQILYYNFNS